MKTENENIITISEAETNADGVLRQLELFHKVEEPEFSYIRDSLIFAFNMGFTRGLSEGYRNAENNWIEALEKRAK
jgi:hypothetical protein